jgi:hypothetical protein
MIRDKSSSTVIGYGLGDRGSIPDRQRDLSLHHHVETGSGEYPAPYPNSFGGSVPGNKTIGA